MTTTTSDKNNEKKFTRRNFLRLSGVAAAGLLVEGCKSKEKTEEAIVTGAGKGVKYQVAVGKLDNYEREAVDKAVTDLVNRLGGLKDIVKPDSRVAIKVNCTGGVSSGLVPGYSAIESFITHPEVVHR
jgi:hypothetical protein